MNHCYVDERALPERFLTGTLAPDERDAFARHFQQCEECQDRVELARIWLEDGLVHHSFWSSSPGSITGKTLVRRRPQFYFFDSWQPATVARLAAMLAVALQYSKTARGYRNDDIPLRARFVAQWTPWQLFAFASAAALVLVLIPATYFLWEFQRLAAAR